MDEANRARTVARHDARVLFRTLGAPAEPTLAACASCTICLLLLRVSRALLIAIFIYVWLEEGHLVGLFKVLLVNLILIVLLVSTYKLLDSKLHPAELDYVKFVDFSTLYHLKTEIMVRLDYLCMTYIVFILGHLLLQLVIAIANHAPDPIQTRFFIAWVPVADLKITGLGIPGHLEQAD